MEPETHVTTWRDKQAAISIFSMRWKIRLVQLGVSAMGDDPSSTSPLTRRMIYWPFGSTRNAIMGIVVGPILTATLAIIILEFVCD